MNNLNKVYLNNKENYKYDQFKVTLCLPLSQS